MATPDDPHAATSPAPPTTPSSGPASEDEGYGLPFDPSLLARFQAWKAGVHTQTGEPARDVRLWTYLYSEASPDLAVAFAKLFWPDFLGVEGYVLLAEHYRPDNFAGWLD